jgi:hypothetical protein
MPASSPFCSFSSFMIYPAAQRRWPGSPPRPQLAILVLAAPPRHAKAEKIAGPYPPKPPKIRTSAYIRENSYIHFRTSFLQSGGCVTNPPISHAQPIIIPIPIAQNEPIVDPKQRTAAAAAACAKGSRQPVERPICSTWRHTKFLERSRLAHTAASHRPVLAAAERHANGWFLANWPRIYVVKKRPCTGHVFLIAVAQFFVLQRPLFSLYELLSTCQCLSSAVLALSHQASIRSPCRSKEFSLV